MTVPSPRKRDFYSINGRLTPVSWSRWFWEQSGKWKGWEAKIGR